LGDALRVLQPARGYRAGLDAVLLAAAVKVAADARVEVLDVGAGVGVVGLCLARRLAQVHVTLVERDPALAALAQQNAVRNGLGDRLQVIEGDVTRPLSTLPGLKARAESFDIVVSNPPYYAMEAGTLAQDAGRAAAHAMPEGMLDRWIRFMASMARPGGRMLLVHRAEALPELLQACRRRFGGLSVRPLYPRQGEAANRILLEGVRGSRAPLTLGPGIVLHAPGGGFSPQVEAALRQGAALA